MAWFNMDKIIDYFLQPQNGVLGIIVVVQGFVVLWQQKRLDSRDKMITDLQEKRKADTDAYTKSYTDTIREVVAAMKDGSSTSALLQRSIDALVQSFQAFINKQ